MSGWLAEVLQGEGAYFISSRRHFRPLVCPFVVLCLHNVLVAVVVAIGGGV